MALHPLFPDPDRIRSTWHECRTKKNPRQESNPWPPWVHMWHLSHMVMVGLLTGTQIFSLSHDCVILINPFFTFHKSHIIGLCFLNTFWLHYVFICCNEQLKKNKKLMLHSWKKSLIINLYILRPLFSVVKVAVVETVGCTLQSDWLSYCRL